MTIDDRTEMIRTRLTEAFAPQELNIIDESHKHIGHASAGGGGHFAIEIVSNAFIDKTLIERHRIVYDSLDDAMKNNEIHALSIKATTPAEAEH